MRERLRAVSAVLVVFVCACQSSARPVSEGTTTTRPRNGDRAPTFLGLSVRLQLGAPEIDPTGTYLPAHFLVDNRTTRTITYSGCAFGSFKFGLLPASDPGGPLTGTAETSCSGGAVSMKPGASDRFFAARFPIRTRNVRAPAGEYVAVVRLADGTKLQRAVTVPPRSG